MAGRDEMKPDEAEKTETRPPQTKPQTKPQMKLPAEISAGLWANTLQPKPEPTPQELRQEREKKQYGFALGAYRYTVAVSYMTTVVLKPKRRTIRRKTILGTVEVDTVLEGTEQEVVRRKVKRFDVIADTAAQACAKAEYHILKGAYMPKGGAYYVSSRVVRMRAVKE